MNVSEFTLNFSSGVPIYRQIVQLISGKILSGALAPGDRIPSIRDVTAELNVNPNTVAKAYRELELGGLIETRRGMGCFVAESAGAKPAEDVTPENTSPSGGDENTPAAETTEVKEEEGMGMFSQKV